MAIITTGTLIVAGVASIIGLSGAIWHASTEDERNAEKIKKLQADNESLTAAKSYIENLKAKLCKSKEYLSEGREDFRNGGHVMDKIPLAYNEFSSCINNLDGAITEANSLIADFNATIENNNNEIRKLQS